MGVSSIDVDLDAEMAESGNDGETNAAPTDHRNTITLGDRNTAHTMYRNRKRLDESCTARRDRLRHCEHGGTVDGYTLSPSAIDEPAMKGAERRSTQVDATAHAWCTRTAGTSRANGNEPAIVEASGELVTEGDPGETLGDHVQITAADACSGDADDFSARISPGVGSLDNLYAFGDPPHCTHPSMMARWSRVTHTCQGEK